jgi:hypothetical protein
MDVGQHAANGNNEIVILSAREIVFCLYRNYKKIGQAKRVRRLCDFAVGCDKH